MSNGIQDPIQYLLLAHLHPTVFLGSPLTSIVIQSYPMTISFYPKIHPLPQTGEKIILIGKHGLISLGHIIKWQHTFWDGLWS